MLTCVAFPQVAHMSRGMKHDAHVGFNGDHYTHFFFTMQPYPPYAIHSLGSEFCIGRQRDPQRDQLDCEVVQFVSGLVRGTGDALWLTYGVNDCSPRLAKLSLRNVLADLRPVHGLGYARGKEAATTRGSHAEGSGMIDGSGERSRATRSRASGSVADGPKGGEFSNAIRVGGSVINGTRALPPRTGRSRARVRP